MILHRDKKRKSTAGVPGRNVNRDRRIAQRPFLAVRRFHSAGIRVGLPASSQAFQSFGPVVAAVRMADHDVLDISRVETELLHVIHDLVLSGVTKQSIEPDNAGGSLYCPCAVCLGGKHIQVVENLPVFGVPVFLRGRAAFRRNGRRAGKMRGAGVIGIEQSRCGRFVAGAVSGVCAKTVAPARNRMLQRAGICALVYRSLPGQSTAKP